MGRLNRIWALSSVLLCAACSFERVPGPSQVPSMDQSAPVQGDGGKRPPPPDAAPSPGSRDDEDEDAGMSEPPSCEAGERRCAASGEGIEVCIAGTRWAGAERCASVCSDATCTGECRPGTMRCRTHQIAEVCTRAGKWGPGPVCPAACVGAGVCAGECRPGLVRCASDGRTPELCDADGSWLAAAAPCETACLDGVCAECVATREVCDALDNDCNGLVDDQVAQPCSTACGRGTEVCSAGRFEACSAEPPAPETCDDEDNDCDGRVDEALTRKCATACGEGVEACERGRFQQCSARRPTRETCNASDEDCDGQVDEGFWAETVMTSYTAAKAHHAGCDGVAERVGPTCNAAIQRFCMSRGCGRHGFGPLENTQDMLVVACVTQVSSMQVPFRTLAEHYPQCNEGSKYGPACNAAMHRFCRKGGFESGFGPTETGPSAANVVCVPKSAATVVETTYTALRTQHASCEGTAERMGRGCNAAIHRTCLARGFITGFGPVENSGDQAVIVCLRAS